MVRKVLMLMAVTLVFSACEVQAAVIYSNWVGGSQGEWGNPENWDPNIIPDNNETDTFFVTINGGSGGVEVSLQQSRTIDQLRCYGNVELGKWTSGWVELTIYNGLTNHGKLDIHDIEINGNVTNIAGATLWLCDMEIKGDLYNQAGAMIYVEYEVCVGSELAIGAGNFENSGTIEIVPYSELYTDDGHFNNLGTILIYGGGWGGDEGILDNNSTGVIKGFGVLHGDRLVRNKGQIYAYGGSLTVLSEGPFLNSGLLSNYPLSSLQIKPAEDVNNNGTIEVHSGGGVAIDSNVVNEPNATILLLGGTLAAASITQSAEANFAGFGTITGDVLIDPNAIIRLIGSTNIVGNMEIGTDATLEISDETTLIINQTTCNNGTIHMIGGRIICRGGLTNNNCNIIWEPGTYANVADFNLDGTVNFKDFADFANTWLWQASWY